MIGKGSFWIKGSVGEGVVVGRWSDECKKIEQKLRRTGCNFLWKFSMNKKKQSGIIGLKIKNFRIGLKCVIEIIKVY